MKTFFLKLVLLFLPIALLLWLIAKWDKRLITNDLKDVKRVLASAKFDSLDGLFVGSSYTYSGLNPRQFDTLGWKTYNLSIGGTGVYFIELIVEDYLKTHEQAPKRVIIDISPQTFSDQTDDWMAYAIHRHLLQPLSHEALVFRYAALGDYFKLLRKSAWQGWKNIGKSPIPLSFEEDSFDLYRGFYANYTRRNAATKQQDARLLKGLKLARFESAKLRRLIWLIEDCKSQNIEVYWFIAPVKDLNPYYARPYLDAYEEAVAVLRRLKTAIEIPIDNTVFQNSDYRNTDHLNVWGAEKLGRQVISTLGAR